MMPMQRSTISDLCILGTIVALVGLTIWKHLSLPQPVGENADPAVFSAERAYRHLKVLASQPRRLFSPHYERSKQYLVNALSNSGIRAEIQNGTSVNPPDPTFYSGVQNIIARIEGASGSDAA